MLVSRVTDPRHFQLVGVPPLDLLEDVARAWRAAGLCVDDCLEAAVRVTRDFTYNRPASGGTRTGFSDLAHRLRPRWRREQQIPVKHRRLAEILNPQPKAAAVFHDLLAWIDRADEAAQRGAPRPAFENAANRPIFPEDDDAWWLTELQKRTLPEAQGDEDGPFLAEEENNTQSEDEQPESDDSSESDDSADLDERGNHHDDDDDDHPHDGADADEPCPGGSGAGAASSSAETAATEAGRWLLWAWQGRREPQSCNNDLTASEGRPNQFSEQQGATPSATGSGGAPERGHSQDEWPQQTSFGQQSAEDSLPEWEIGHDGQPLRTEFGLQAALLRQGLQRNLSETFGRNNCLVDSLLLALRYAGCIRQDISFEERREACAAARWHLVQHHGVDARNDDYLSHDLHLAPIFNFLRNNCPTVWEDSATAHTIQLTADIFDRFHFRRVLAHDGSIDELAPTNPVCVPPLGIDGAHQPSTNHILVQLYCYTHRDGNGYHYEWISAAGETSARERAPASGAAAGHQPQRQQQNAQPREIPVPSDNDAMNREEPEEEPTRDADAAVAPREAPDVASAGLQTASATLSRTPPIFSCSMPGHTSSSMIEGCVHCMRYFDQLEAWNASGRS